MLVASSCASLSAPPSSRKITRLRSVVASQLGRGKLPMVVVAIGGSCMGFHLRGFSLAIYTMISKYNLSKMDYLRLRIYSRSEEHTSELQSRGHLVCRLLLEKKKIHINHISII